MRLFRLILFIVIFILFSCIVLGNILINEIMFDPEGADEGHEWIEIYSNSSVNISGWKFYEDGTSHGLTLINGSWILNGYAIIANEWNTFLADYPAYIGTLIDSSWSSLSQSGESLALKNSSGDIIEEVNYSSSWGGEDGISLERIDPLKPSNNATNWGSSLVSKGTPGKQNSLFGSCDWSISIILDDTIMAMENDIAVVKWKIETEKISGDGKINFSYWIEDPAGEIVKSKVYGSTNASKTFGEYQKTFHDSGGYIIFANITNAGCFDFNPANDFAKTAIIVTGGTQGSSPPTSTLQISDAPSSAEFGDIVNVKINVYRGGTDKYAVYTYIENEHGTDVSEKSTMHFTTKFTNYTLKVPIQLDFNCDEDYEDDDYTIVLEGLDVKDTKEISLDGKSSDCGKTTSSSDSSGSHSSSSSSSSSKSSSSDDKKETKTTSGRFYYELVGKPENIFLGDEFSSSVKVENTKGYSINTKVYSYVYRGSKCYSGERTENMQEFILASGESKTIELKNIVEEAEPGEYNFKVRIERNDIKSGNEITSSINLLERENKNNPEEPEKISEEKENQAQENEEYKFKRLPKVIYQSVSYKSKSLVPYLIVFISVLTAVILVWKR